CAGQGFCRYHFGRVALVATMNKADATSASLPCAILPLCCPAQYFQRKPAKTFLQIPAFLVEYIIPFVGANVRLRGEVAEWLKAAVC
ncbi:MAG: hypothetical protein IKH04_07140, partial [Kiritimatiellae bacterium]|nr:hypothetical protein [Kiritimatiellia bacterium]